MSKDDDASMSEKNGTLSVIQLSPIKDPELYDFFIRKADALPRIKGKLVKAILLNAVRTGIADDLLNQFSGLGFTAQNKSVQTSVEHHAIPAQAIVPSHAADNVVKEVSQPIQLNDQSSTGIAAPIFVSTVPSTPEVKPNPTPLPDISAHPKADVPESTSTMFKSAGEWDDE